MTAISEIAIPDQRHGDDRPRTSHKPHMSQIGSGGFSSLPRIPASFLILTTINTMLNGVGTGAFDTDLLKVDSSAGHK